MNHISVIVYYPKIYLFYDLPEHISDKEIKARFYGDSKVEFVSVRRDWITPKVDQIICRSLEPVWSSPRNKVLKPAGRITKVEKNIVYYIDNFESKPYYFGDLPKDTNNLFIWRFHNRLNTNYLWT